MAPTETLEWHTFTPPTDGRLWRDPWSGKDEPACSICGVGESRAVHHRDQVRTTFRDPPRQCDIRGCVGVVEHSFFYMNADLTIKEQVDLCTHHTELIGALAEGGDDSHGE